MYRAQISYWSMERVIRLMAGMFSLAGIVLSLVVHIYWIILPVLVGVNLVIFAATGFCPMALLLYRMGVRPECAERSI